MGGGKGNKDKMTVQENKDEIYTKGNKDKSIRKRKKAKGKMTGKGILK
jgi:hypothetical protein